MKVVFRPLCGFIRSQSQLVYNKDISQYSCLCEICENVVFTFKSLWRNEQVLPNNPNYLVQQFSCNSSSRTCMYDYICAVCESLLLNLRDFGFNKWTSKSTNGKRLTTRSKKKSLTCPLITGWKVSKYGVLPGPYIPAFSPNAEKYGPEKTPYLDTFHAVNELVQMFNVQIQTLKKHIFFKREQNKFYNHPKEHL